MTSPIITSMTNAYVKKVIELKSTKVIKEKKLFIVEGEHLVLEAMKNHQLKEVVVVQKASNLVLENIKQTLVTVEVMKKISDLKTPAHIIGVCEIKESQVDFKDNILILENIQDPGNMGSLIRCAAAFNFKTIIASEDCVSFFNSKTIRATQGNLFAINLVSQDSIEAIRQALDHDFEIIGTDLKKPSVDFDEIKTPKLKALLLGNEGTGLSTKATSLITRNFLININPEVESLNVSIAGAIIMNLINQ
ncbi:RNA methyltransferase [Spiroplasma endosymbiont of Panorpa germanica]|uniref:TrmH family RNA methyltransferase n=1 Tax=Spiroplasma endosymbiont of Panorpa germanica TaxID=3066314 RepID=UPI0030D5D8BA